MKFAMKKLEVNHMTDKQFIEAVYEIAFGEDAINRNFGHAEVIEQLEEFSDDSLKWDSIPDEDKEEWEEAYNEGAYLIMEHYD